MQIVTTKTIKLKDGAKFDAGMVLTVSKEELKERGFPQDSYRVRDPDNPASTDQSQTNGKPPASNK